MSTNVETFMADLDAGTVQDKLGTMLSLVAASVVDTGKQGKVAISFDIKQIGNSHQVEISNKLAYARPTARGKQNEEETTVTPMHVGTGGDMSFFPENQVEMFGKNKENSHA
jgi:hypothetical protein